MLLYHLAAQFGNTRTSAGRRSRRRRFYEWFGGHLLWETRNENCLFHVFISGGSLLTGASGFFPGNRLSAPFRRSGSQFVCQQIDPKEGQGTLPPGENAGSLRRFQGKVLSETRLSFPNRIRSLPSKRIRRRAFSEPAKTRSHFLPLPSPLSSRSSSLPRRRNPISGFPRSARIKNLL